MSLISESSSDVRPPLIRLHLVGRGATLDLSLWCHVGPILAIKTSPGGGDHFCSQNWSPPPRTSFRGPLNVMNMHSEVALLQCIPSFFGEAIIAGHVEILEGKKEKRKKRITSDTMELVALVAADRAVTV